MYDVDTFENFVELEERYPSLAKALLEDVGEGEWQTDTLYFYPTHQDYAQYELEDGWYSTHDLGGDFGGAPNPLDYIDLDGFAEALLVNCDGSVYREIEDGVMQTGYGF